MPDNLPELRDIHLPDGVSAWPVAYGWWVILLLLIGAVVLYRLFKLWRLKSQKLYALRLLNSTDDKNVINSAAAVSEILRRICVYKYPQAAVLNGQDWINFLNTHSKSLKIEGKEADLLLNAPYMPSESALFDHANLQRLKDFCSHWIGENL